MRSSKIYRLFLVLLAMAAGTHVSSYAAVQNRITSAVQGSSRVSLAHTVSPRAAHAADLGAASSSTKLENLALRFSMTDAQQAALSQLLLDQQNPSSPRYHQWLTPQQFGAQFGLSADDIAKVSSWLTSQGFTVTDTAKSSTFITFSGTAAQAQQAFGTTLHSVSLDGEQHIANLTEPTLPTAIGGVVSYISGLNDFRFKPHIRKNVAKPQYTIAVCTVQTNPCPSGDITVANFVVPGDFYTIYDVNPLLSNAINGQGISIAVMGQVDLTQSDVAAFRTASGLVGNMPQVITYGSDPGLPSQACLSANPPDTCAITAGDVMESQLDVEWAGAVAPAATIIFVQSTNVIETSLVGAIDNNIASIMSVSYGGCEILSSAGDLQSLNTVFQQANAEGITIVGPSGDAGATDCDPASAAANQATATHGLAVDFPASSPSVTGVGGTEFNEAGGTYWGTNGPLQTSARSYIPEMVWNDTTAEVATDPTDAVLSASGGGLSVVFPKPVWQTGSGVPADGHRDVPDVALNASAIHDSYIFCALSSCQGGGYFVTSGSNQGSFNTAGGTSFGAPEFAGILSLVEQKLDGARLGNANPYIYWLANNNPAVFHDVTTGNNNSPCAAKSTGCPAGGGSIGYAAGPGYDQATGWGSVDVNSFVNNFSSAVAAVGLKGTTTTAITSSASNPNAGQGVTFTATVAAAGGATPTGTVSFSVDNGNSSPVTLTSGAATFTTTFSNNGAHTVTATYSGDSNNFGSAGTEKIIVGPVPTGSFALSASPASFTISSGGNISSTITVTPSGGYNGTVNLTASAPTLSGTYSFSVGSVSLTSGGSATSTFTVNTVSAGSSFRSVSGFGKGSTSSALVIGGGATFAGLFLFGLIGPRRRRLGTILSLIVFAAMFTAMGCGSGSSTTTPGSGTYTITLTGTDSVTNSITSSTNITVMIH